MPVAGLVKLREVCLNLYTVEKSNKIITIDAQ